MDSQKTATPTASPVTSDEKFKQENHAIIMLSKMNQYYQNSKLKDVTLIAGTFVIHLNHITDLINQSSFNVFRWETN